LSEQIFTLQIKDLGESIYESMIIFDSLVLILLFFRVCLNHNKTSRDLSGSLRRFLSKAVAFKLMIQMLPNGRTDDE